MNIGRLGGASLAVGCAVVLVLYAVAVIGTSPFGIGIGSVVGLLTGVSLAVAGGGAAILGFAGRPPVEGVLLRLGVASLGIGLICIAASSLAADSLTYDPLESMPVIVLLLIGLAAAAFALVATPIGLLRRPGSARAVGGLFLTGVLLVLVAGLVQTNRPGDGNDLVHAISGGVIMIGYAVIIASWIGLGMLAVIGDPTVAEGQS